MKLATALLVLYFLGVVTYSYQAAISGGDEEELTGGDAEEGKEDYPDDDAELDEEDEEGPPPKIRSRGRHMDVAIGEAISLPCEVQNSKDAVIQWRRLPSTPLYLDQTKQIKDDRYTMDAQFTLHIKDVQERDAGEYTCQILGFTDEIVHYTVNIISEPKILRIVPEGPQKTLRKGQPLTLMCEAIGEPKPKIHWTHKKKHSMKETPLQGETITYDMVSRKTSGEYTCTADNGKGSLDQKTIAIEVEYEPEIEVQKEVVNSAEGYESELVCIVHAHPSAKVTWFKDGRTVKESHHYAQFVEGNKHILRISNTKNSDFGTYMCIAQNDIGTSNKTAALSGLPSKPSFHSTNVADDGKSPVLTWKVASHSPITAFELMYKKQQEDKWDTASPAVVPDGENSFIASHTLRNLEPGTYVAQIRAKNMYGWSSISEPKIFSGDIIGESGAMQSKYLESSNSGAVNLEMRISVVFILSLLVARFLS